MQILLQYIKRLNYASNQEFVLNPLAYSIYLIFYLIAMNYVSNHFILALENGNSQLFENFLCICKQKIKIWWIED